MYYTLKEKIFQFLFKKISKRLDKEYYILSKAHITYSNDLLYTFHNADFIKDSKFSEIYKEVKLIGGKLLENYDIEWRIHVITYFANLVKHLDGDFVDCGVNTGFCPLAVIKYTNFSSLGKNYYFFDTFEGMDPRFSNQKEMERHQKLEYGNNSNLFNEVSKRFENYNVKIIKGAVPESLIYYEGSRVSYLSIDMNCVLPEVEALNFFWDKIVRGGVIILDDYGYPGCYEQKCAHDAFAKSKGVEILTLPTCQGIIIKQ